MTDKWFLSNYGNYAIIQNAKNLWLARSVKSG